jgi:hypothetical protein
MTTVPVTEPPPAAEAPTPSGPWARLRRRLSNPWGQPRFLVATTW